jgi:hypothetical protein
MLRNRQLLTKDSAPWSQFVKGCYVIHTVHILHQYTIQQTQHTEYSLYIGLNIDVKELFSALYYSYIDSIPK